MIEYSLLRSLLTDAFIETGSGGGNGLVAANKAGFKAIYGIEKDKEMLGILRKRFFDNDHINIVESDGAYGIANILNKHKFNKVTFSLDTTPNKTETEDIPLMRELGVIGCRKYKHNIIINNIDIVYKYVPEDILETVLLNINRNYTIEKRGNLLVVV